jgi:polar amino acid transport system substrate-binding protein
MLTACASHSPPFVLYDKGRVVSGFSSDLLGSIARGANYELRIKEMPWPRCLNEVKSGRVDLAMDAYDDLERRKVFLYSSHYHVLTPQVFFRAATPIASAQISTVKDLQRFKGCGVRDFTYEHYDLKASTLDLGALDDQKMLLKLKAGHCDYAVEELEYIIGGRSSVAKWPDESDLSSIRPGWARGPKVHFLVGKTRPGAQALMAEIDLGVASAEKSGETAALRKKYLDAAPATRKDKPSK